MENAVVIDNGTRVVKAGMSGDNKPTVSIANAIGRPKHVRVMTGGEMQGGIFFGAKAAAHRGALSLRHPMERGAVTPGEWENMELIWRYIFGKPGQSSDESLGISPKDQPVSHRVASIWAVLRDTSSTQESKLVTLRVPSFYRRSCLRKRPWHRATTESAVRK